MQLNPLTRKPANGFNLRVKSLGKMPAPTPDTTKPARMLCHKSQAGFAVLIPRRITPRVVVVLLDRTDSQVPPAVVKSICVDVIDNHSCRRSKKHPVHKQANLFAVDDTPVCNVILCAAFAAQQGPRPRQDGICVYFVKVDR
jgi:hypothetical protein